MSFSTPLTSRALSRWLFLCCFLIIGIIMVGAITRLTESGLSMVEWRAMVDMLPPLSDSAWLSEFQKYQLTPEYIEKNNGMTLEAFKSIYFWEWLHRLLGRVIGLVYALPLLYFWIIGKIPARLEKRFILFLFLGGLQGFFGWYMVKSGLINEPRVSHFRLALHLGTAFLLLSLLWVQGLYLSNRANKLATKYATIFTNKFIPHAWAALVVICITIAWGAFVAGLDAGMIYNEFPLMGGKLIPGELLEMTPWWKNFIFNHTTVQWTHRVLGTTSFIVVFSLAMRFVFDRNKLLKRIGGFIAAAILVQFILGIVTLLSVVAVPLAVLHQFGAVIVLLSVLTSLAFLHYKHKD